MLKKKWITVTIDEITAKPKKIFIKKLSLFLSFIKLPYPAIDVDNTIMLKKKRIIFKVNI